MCAFAMSRVSRREWKSSGASLGKATPRAYALCTCGMDRVGRSSASSPPRRSLDLCSFTELRRERWLDWQRSPSVVPANREVSCMTERGRRRVVISGVGAITPIGLAVEGLWDGLRAQRSKVREISRFDSSLFRSRLAAQVDDFVPGDFLEAKRTKRLDRFGQFSVAAARLAIEDSEIDLAAEDRERIGAMMGTALGGVGYAEEQCSVFYTGNVKDVDPALALMVFGGASSCNIAIEFGVMGPNSTNAMSCASGTIAIGEAFRQIRDGYADVMLGGGAEAPLYPLCYGAFALIRAMSTRNDDPCTASRPFDKDRDGFVMGEGASVLVLEERSRAIARGAKIYGEIAGFGMSNDAYHMTAPRPDGTQAARSMRRALEDAGVNADEVGYVNAHGSSTPLNDST